MVSRLVYLMAVKNRTEPLTIGLRLTLDSLEFLRCEAVNKSDNGLARFSYDALEVAERVQPDAGCFVLMFHRVCILLQILCIVNHCLARDLQDKIGISNRSAQPFDRSCLGCFAGMDVVFHGGVVARVSENRLDNAGVRA